VWSKAPSDVGAFSLKNAMDDKDNYKQLVSNLADLAVDLALESEYNRRKTGEVANLDKHPDTIKKHERFQPPLAKLKASTTDKEAADAVQSILAAIAQFLR
jgi:hypothetical protein